MIGVWPLIMGVTMFLQMRMNPTPPDPTQAMIFTWMPVIFTFMLASFPAGLVIYWAWNNTLSILQQGVIMKRQGVKIELWDNIKSMFGKKPGKPGRQASRQANRQERQARGRDQGVDAATAGEDRPAAAVEAGPGSSRALGFCAAASALAPCPCRRASRSPSPGAPMSQVEAGQRPRGTEGARPHLQHAGTDAGAELLFPTPR